VSIHSTGEDHLSVIHNKGSKMKTKKITNLIGQILGIRKNEPVNQWANPVNPWENTVLPADFDKASINTFQYVKEFTMTSPERVKALVDSVKYIVNSKIEGAFVECGVWRGGSAMAMAHILQEMGDVEREIFLYDTFTGMTAPTEVDISVLGKTAKEIFQQTKVSDDASDWCFSPIDGVRENVFKTGYPKDKIHLIKGKVEDTIPGVVPSKIALLRLDTDWYESTKHEMVHLFPLLAPYGILIIDDYGDWQGAKKAIDEYISDNSLRIFLNRIDISGRLAIKIPE
jgi:O-methyltransferase